MRPFPCFLRNGEEDVRGSGCLFSLSLSFVPLSLSLPLAPPSRRSGSLAAKYDVIRRRPCAAGRGRTQRVVRPTAARVNIPPSCPLLSQVKTTDRGYVISKLPIEEQKKRGISSKALAVRIDGRVSSHLSAAQHTHTHSTQHTAPAPLTTNLTNRTTVALQPRSAATCKRPSRPSPTTRSKQRCAARCAAAVELLGHDSDIFLWRSRSHVPPWTVGRDHGRGLLDRG